MDLGLSKSSKALSLSETVAHQVVLSPLEQELVDRGVSSGVASQLVAEFSEEEIQAECELFDWLKEKKPTKVKDDGAYLASAIRGRFSEKLPQGFETKSDRQKRELAKQTEQRRVSEAARKAREARAAETAVKSKVDEYLTQRAAKDGGLEQFNAEALKQADPVMLAAYEQMPRSSIRQGFLRVIREKHVRKLLGIPEPGES
ncbi:hypothetical protein TA3x_005798 (plasmid) [Tundrisphaera sp. TA3]|uniref:hypothetical protein n=1 Tax=Tundrisphaera sp. TA3 TaxID=3435775 RepID=UPI003EBDFFB0